MRRIARFSRRSFPSEHLDVYQRDGGKSTGCVGIYLRWHSLELAWGSGARDFVFCGRDGMNSPPRSGPRPNRDASECTRLIAHDSPSMARATLHQAVTRPEDCLSTF